MRLEQKLTKTAILWQATVSLHVHLPRLYTQCLEPHYKHRLEQETKTHTNQWVVHQEGQLR